jgi:hypothetical protein
MFRCAKCAAVKPAAGFYKRDNGKPASYCRTCCLSNNRRYYRDDPARSLLKSVKQGAKKRGIQVAITEADIRIPGVCPVLGIPLRIAEGRMDDNSPSVDRLDSSRGYTPDNINIISWRANRLKNDASLAELEAIVLWLRAQ